MKTCWSEMRLKTGTSFSRQPNTARIAWQAAQLQTDIFPTAVSTFMAAATLGLLKY